jgi:Ca-activated chloride channel homolog
MARLLRSPRTLAPPTLLLLSALTLLTGACDRGGALGPLDHERTEQRKRQREAETAVAPVRLELDSTLANGLIPAGQASELVARIRIAAPEQLDLPRPPARVVLLVDTSASMQDRGIEGAKRAASELVDSLADGDSFSLVVFHSRAEVLMSATIIGAESRTAAKAEIAKMQAWGTTDLAGGLQLALEELARSPLDMAPRAATGDLVAVGPGVWTSGGPDPQVLERVVLLGDGVPNDPSPIAGLTAQFAARGAEITALGYGLEYDEVLLASLAEQTHGSYRFVEDPEAVAALFRDEVLHIQRTVARDLRLALGLGPGVQLLEVVGHPLAWNSNRSRVEIALGSIAEAQTVELIVRFAVGPHSDGAAVELSDLELTFTDVHTGTGDRFERSFLAARASADQAAISEGLVVDVARAGARARTHAATLQVLSLARSGQSEQAKDLLAKTVSAAKHEAAALADDQLDALAEELAALAPELAALAPELPAPARPHPIASGPAKSSTPGDASDRPQPFPAQPSTAGARKIKAAHSAAYNGIHE